MEKNKAPLFSMSIVAIIVGVALFKQFDFQTLKFQKIGLSIVYAITLVFAVYVIVKGLNRKRSS